jgi:hypothetical protein
MQLWLQSWTAGSWDFTTWISPARKEISLHGKLSNQTTLLGRSARPPVICFSEFNRLAVLESQFFEAGDQSFAKRALRLVNRRAAILLHSSEIHPVVTFP